MPEAIPVENLAVTMQSIVREIFSGMCLSKKVDGIDVSILKDEVQVQLSVIAPAGLNSITRRTVTNTGGETTTTKTSEKVTDDTEESFTQSTKADGFISVTTTTKEDPFQKTVRKSPLKTSTTLQVSLPDTTISDETQDSEQHSDRTAFGGDTVTRRTEYDEV